MNAQERTWSHQSFQLFEEINIFSHNGPICRSPHSSSIQKGKSGLVWTFNPQIYWLKRKCKCSPISHPAAGRPSLHVSQTVGLSSWWEEGCTSRKPHYQTSGLLALDHTQQTAWVAGPNRTPEQEERIQQRCIQDLNIQLQFKEMDGEMIDWLIDLKMTQIFTNMFMVR